MNGDLVLPRVKLSHNVSVVHIEDGPESSKSAEEVVTCARNVFNTHKTKSLAFRKEQLKNLVRFLEDEEEELCNALYQDLRKPKLEAVSHEIAVAVKEAKDMLSNLSSWMKPERPDRTAANFFDKLYIYNDPYGVVLVIGAWNFPVHLLIIPVIGAIAAGNCVVIKPSELAPSTAQAFATILPKYLDPDCYPVYLGGKDETTELLKQRFDYIFFTGSPQVGKIIYETAVKNLTPVTLELGGKCPVYIDSTADIELTAKRVIWGKTQNAGQICIAPDYVLCTKKVQDKFLQYAEKALQQFYNGNAKTSTDYGRIVSQRHFTRLIDLLRNQKTAIGGRTDPLDLYIQPTVLVDVSPTDPVMQQEIFGPILPIINVNGADEAIDFINSREKPLALYVFTKDRRVQDAFLKETSSGSLCLNDTIMQVIAEGLPFGGVGNSGIGSYHGKKSFDIFVHKKSVLSKGFFFLPEKIESARYPPYTKAKLNLMRVRFKYDYHLTNKFILPFFLYALGILSAVTFYYAWNFFRD